MVVVICFAKETTELRDFLRKKFDFAEEIFVTTNLKNFLTLAKKHRNAILIVDRNYKNQFKGTSLPIIFADFSDIPKNEPKIHPIKQRIAEILKEYGPLHGYEIAKIYERRFGRINLRLIYYHLYSGVKEGVFERVEEKEEEGDYSWGKLARKVYYRVKGSNL